MVIAKMTVSLATPNEDGRKIDFTTPKTAKEILNYIKKFNNEQSVKELKIKKLNTDSIVLLLKANMDESSLQKNGRDIVALSNILRDEGWFKYSNSDKLLAVHSYEVLKDFDVKFENAGILPSEYAYIWTDDFSNILSDEDAIKLFELLLVLVKNEKLSSEVSRKKHKNALCNIKAELVNVFH